jgi:hypothetical protein
LRAGALIVIVLMAVTGLLWSTRITTVTFRRKRPSLRSSRAA